MPQIYTLYKPHTNTWYAYYTHNICEMYSIHNSQPQYTHNVHYKCDIHTYTLPYTRYTHSTGCTLYHTH
uniref:Uncharacterized protein n=1 Tax=Anguilla anguilla TaxID=7936 RepID=A0A0E9PHY5_ANGAN